MEQTLRRIPPVNLAHWMKWAAVLLVISLLIAAVATPNLLRSRIAANESAAVGTLRSIRAQLNAAKEEHQTFDRQVVQKVELTIELADVRGAIEQLDTIVADAGGYVEASASAERQGQAVIRVPAGSMGIVIPQLRGLGKLKAETLAREDVTAVSADLEATIRNQRAEEAQYLAIMKRSGSIKDTLEVARHLADVRGRIETNEARRKLMSSEVAMVRVGISLHSPGVAVTAGWQPGVSAREAWTAAKRDLAAFGDFLIVVVLRAPVIALWLFAIGFGVYWIYRGTHRVARRFLPQQTVLPAVPQP